VPDVKVYYPTGLFETERRREKFHDAVAKAVAFYLSCEDYSGVPFTLQAAQVDVTLIAYDYIPTRPGSVIRMEISGINFTECMRTIKTRLEAIKVEVKKLLLPTRDTVSIIFRPVHPNCWVSDE
jgi:hypothetical protein